MAQDPLNPKDDGKIKLPRIDAGMNKTRPKSVGGGKGADTDPKGEAKPKRRTKQEPALSATTDAPEALQDAMKDGDGSDMAPVPQGAGDNGEDFDPVEKEKLLARIRKRLDRAIKVESDNRKSAVEDLKFKKGDQWPADIQAQRNFDKRPCLTINKIPTFVHQVTNDLRQNRPSINVSPVGDKGDLEGAKMYRGLIRSIERASAADIAYDTAVTGACDCGFGYFRILTEYEDDDGFDQVLVISRVRNQFTVYLDCDRQQPDGSDSKWGFVTEMLPRDEFKEEYPWADEMPFTQGGVGDGTKPWIDKDTIRVAEYYEIKIERKPLVKLSNGWTGWKDQISDDVQALIDEEHVEIIAERMSHSPVVWWYKVTAMDVLEYGPTVFRWIPIVPVIGDEIDIEGKVTYSGIIRNAKDPQRMYNYWKTSETELVALAPKAPFVMEEGQVEGHEPQWKKANTTSYPYLLYKGTNLNGTPAPAPQRQPLVGSPAGIVGAAAGAAQDMMATTGVRFDGTPSNERATDESGRVMQEIRRNSDLGSFHYADNLARSLRHAGRILVDAIPKVYDQRRTLTILREDDKDEMIMLDPGAPKGVGEGKQPNGKAIKIFNPNVGKFGVTVTVGPSYATKRIEASESMLAFTRALPNTAVVIADLIAKNQDWPGAEEMATRLAKVIAQQHPGIMTPDMKDVPPQMQALLTSMDAQIKQLGTERMQMMQLLNDKTADRAMEQDKINKDFESKMTKVLADFESKSEATHQRAIASFEAHLGQEVRALGDSVGQMMELLQKPPAAANNSMEAASA